MYAKAKVGGFLHLAIGEEATIVGSARAMRDDDYLISTYRSHGHALARGTDPNGVMAELFGRVDGVLARGAAARCTCSTSRGASWAATGSSAATCRSRPASAWPPTTWAPRTRRCARSATAPPTRAPSARRMNLAALWKLPVVFMVTNNQFGMGTALERHSAVTDLQRKGEGFGVPGMELRRHGRRSTPSRVTQEALRIAREERRPVLVEAITYRFRGHSMADPEEYRTKEQVEEWRKRDPILALRRPPRGRGHRQRRRARAARRRTRSRASTTAVAFADESAVPAARVALRRRLRPRRPGPRLVLGRRALGRRAQAARTSASSPGRTRLDRRQVERDGDVRSR